MKVRLHPHAEDRLQERGATREEVIATIERGERHNNRYSTKQVEAYAVEAGDGWLAITGVVKFF